jgi:hypothetical protein
MGNKGKAEETQEHAVFEETWEEDRSGKASSGGCSGVAQERRKERAKRLKI